MVARDPTSVRWTGQGNLGLRTRSVEGSQLGGIQDDGRKPVVNVTNGPWAGADNGPSQFTR